MANKVRRSAALILVLGFLLTLVFSFPADAAIISNAGTYKAVLADYDNCLTSSQEADILMRMEKAAQNTKSHIGIVITANLDGYDDEGYAEAFGHEYFGNDQFIVLMLLNTHGNPAYRNYTDVIHSYDSFDDKFYGKHKKLFNALYRGLEKSDGSYDFYDGCKRYIAAVNIQGGTGSQAFMARLADYILNHIFEIMFGLIFAFILSFCIVAGTAKGYKRKKPISASVYLDGGRTKITRQVDTFIREYTTSYTTSSSSGGRGGGGHHSGGHSSHGHHR